MGHEERGKGAPSQAGRGRWGRGRRRWQTIRAFSHNLPSTITDTAELQQLSKHTKRIIIFSVLAVVILAGAFIAWKWGKSIWDHAVDFVTFPTVTTRASTPFVSAAVAAGEFN